MANSVSDRSLISVYTVCQDLSIQIFMIIKELENQIPGPAEWLGMRS